MLNHSSDSPGKGLIRRWRDPAAGLERTFPPPKQCLSMLDALADASVASSPDAHQRGVELARQIDGLLGQLERFDRISRCPIVALAGQLNAGKSSLLATYLSPANRQRVLRGVANEAGTHRFVLWLPQVWWNDADLLNILIGFISSLFGSPPERLSDDPHQAFAQYNGQILTDRLLRVDHQQANATTAENASWTEHADSLDPLSVPLIAYDQQLDELRLGLLDCPDIQTGFLAGEGLAAGRVESPSSGGQETGSNSLGAAARSHVPPETLAAKRQQQLSRIGRLCSAFVVVSKLNSLHDVVLQQILTTLRDSMPGVPRLLAINRIKSRYAPATVYAEARGLVERFGLEGVYAAYDFRSAQAASRIPSAPLGMNITDGAQPIFFELSADPSRADSISAPAGVPPSNPPTRYLFDLGKRLDAGSLAHASLRSLEAQLNTYTLHASEWIAEVQQQRQQQVHDAWQTIADACYEFMAERDADGRAVGLRLQASPAIISQMADSLQRAAPLWMQVSLRIDRTARQFHQAIGSAASRFTIWQSASQAVTQFTHRFRRGDGAQVVTPARLSEALRSYDRHDALESIETSGLMVASELILQRFSAENTTLLDAQELQQWSERVWKEMSWRDKLWKGTQPLAVMLAPLLAVVLVPFDGGGSAVLVFASTKELLTAAGLAALLGPAATGGEALSIVQRETPWRQLSDLFAIACDSLGLPRPQSATEMPSIVYAGSSRRLVISSLETKRSPLPPAFGQWRRPSA